jgi:hypothetical protein
MNPDGRVLLVLLASCVVVAGAGAPAAASSPPSSVCPVCGGAYPGMWTDTDWTTPDDRTLTVRVHENGSATWIADLRWDDTEDAPGPDEADAVESAAEDTLADALYLPEHEAVAVEVREGRTQVTWKTPGVVAERFDHGVFRPFHGEGSSRTLVLNVEKLVVRAPAGQVVTNDPAVGTVTDDGTEVRVVGGDGTDRYLDDAYVVFGDERDAASGISTELAVGSLLWPIAGRNLLWLLVVPAVAFCVGLAGLHAAGRRWGAAPDRTERYGAAGLAVGLPALFAAVVGPVPFGSLSSLPGVLLALAALAAFGYAAAADDRRLLVAAGAAVPVVGLAPFVANAWPAVQVTNLYFLTSLAYTGFAVAVVVLGAPWYLFGLALGRRETTP